MIRLQFKQALPARWRQRPLAKRSVASLVLCTGLLVAAVISFRESQPPTATAAEVARLSLTPGTSSKPVSLRDRLVAGLQARRGSEVEFIDRVVAKVRLGKLPERLVNQTFFWARDRARRTSTPTAGTQRPIIYFQPVMTAQAKRLGVTL